jgi:NADPH2:quinone reductase
MRVTGVRIHAYGASDQLRLETFEIAPPGPGEVLVRHRAVGVNFADIHNRTGRYPLPSLPHVLGGEAAGLVETVGPNVLEFKPGDRVAYAAGGPDVAPGAYAEARVMRADRLVGLPEEIDEVTAASIMTKGLTAQYLLKAAYRVAPGDTILVHAAAGGVGLLLTQWARYLGCRVIGAVSSDAKADAAQASGCHHVIVAPREDIASRVRALTAGRGVPVVFDSVGRDTFEASLRSLEPHGCLVSFGSSSGAVPPFDVFQLNRLGSLHVTSAGFAWFVRSRDELLARASDLFSAVLMGVVATRPFKSYPLGEVRAAHDDLEGCRTIGPSVLVP